MHADDRYDSLIQYWWDQAANEYGMDGADWRLGKCQVRAESSFNPRAVSHVGARGLLQLMPETWGADFDRAFEPEENLKRGLAHLGSLWAIFKAEEGLERWKFALGAYVSGQGHIINAQTAAQAAGYPTNQWLYIALELPKIISGPNAVACKNYVREVISAYRALAEVG